MIHNESRLNKVFLCIFFKEQVKNIALLMSVLIFNVVLIGNLTSLFKCINFVKVNACVLFNCVNHCYTFKRLTQIHFYTVIHDCSCTKHFLSNVAVKIFCKIHHTVIICVCLIQFHKSKFRVMASVKTFVSENSSYFINLIKAAHDKTL